MSTEIRKSTTYQNILYIFDLFYSVIYCCLGCLSRVRVFGVFVFLLLLFWVFVWGLFCLGQWVWFDDVRSPVETREV